MDLKQPGVRRIVSALSALVVGVCLAGAPWALPAHAHVAIVLVVLEPQEGERVSADTEVVVFAQPTLGGVDATTFTLTLDGQPIDPATGREAPGPRARRILVEERVRVPLSDLDEGSHTLAVRYRPDVDEPATETSVTFVVASDGAGAVPVTASVAGALILAGALWWVWRRSRRQPPTMGGRLSGSR